MHQTVEAYIPTILGLLTVGIIQIDPRYFRPAEVDFLLGDPTKAKANLGWEPTMSFEELVKSMVAADLKENEGDLL